ncbi:MAG: SPFH domain-containing protein [Caldilineae bacterium]|nr:MAG: SPFH domain-containing protein [Caldilineae bacterium]
MPRILDVIQAPDQRPDQLVLRVPADGWGDIRLGSQLIVGESQNAVFFRDGKALDTFGPGRHTLTTANIPLLIDLLGVAFSGESPFKASVYFVNMADILDLKWGTPQPVALRDKDLGMVRLRAFGSYSVKVADAQRFVAQVVGQRGYYRTEEIADWLRGQLVAAFTDLLGETKAGLFDLPALVDELGVALRAKVSESFEQSGITLKQVFVRSISATEETLQAIDERAAMGAIGDMNAYLRFKAARALGDAAASAGEGGGAGEGVGAGMGLGAGIGMGAGLGGLIAQAMQGAMQPQQPAAAPAQQTAAPKTRAEIEALLDSLDMRLANGEISEATYDRLVAKWQKRLEELE